jgi:hypothetical protein
MVTSLELELDLELELELHQLSPVSVSSIHPNLMKAKVGTLRHRSGIK